MAKELKGVKLGKASIEHCVRFCYWVSEGLDVLKRKIVSREEFLSMAKERTAEIPDRAYAFVFFDLVTVELFFPNGSTAQFKGKINESDVYYYEAKYSDDPGYLVTRFGEKVPIVRDGDQII